MGLAALVPQLLTAIDPTNSIKESLKLAVLVSTGVITGLAFSRASYFSFKYTYMGSALLLSAAIEAAILFESPLVSLALLVVSAGGI